MTKTKKDTNKSESSIRMFFIQLKRIKSSMPMPTPSSHPVISHSRSWSNMNTQKPEAWIHIPSTSRTDQLQHSVDVPRQSRDVPRWQITCTQRPLFEYAWELIRTIKNIVGTYHIVIQEVEVGVEDGACEFYHIRVSKLPLGYFRS